RGARRTLDPKSNEPGFRTDVTRRFEKDADAEAQLNRTVRLDRVKQEDYDTVFYPGGHGPMWDIAEDKNSIKLIESFLAAGKPVPVRNEGDLWQRSIRRSAHAARSSLSSTSILRSSPSATAWTARNRQAG